MASKVEIRHRDDGALLGYFYTHLDPQDLRRHVAAHGMQAFAEDLGIFIPEINDPYATPVYDRPGVIVGRMTTIDDETYQTILARE